MVRWARLTKLVGCATVALYGGTYVYSRVTCAKYQITHDLSKRSFLITGASAGMFTVKRYLELSYCSAYSSSTYIYNPFSKYGINLAF